MVVVRNLTRVYPSVKGEQPVRALEGLHLRVARGTVVAVRGDSGSGKTTLLSLIGGLDVPDTGSIVVDGQEITLLSEAELVRYRASKIGFIFQTYYLVPTLSAQENVEFALEPLGIPPAERQERAREALKLVGMRKRAHHRPSELSGGEQQRVGIARALVKRPTLVLADEPTGNLDSKSRHVVLDFLLHSAREYGTTTIVVTHDPYVAERCDVDHKIKNGRITKTIQRAKGISVPTEPSASRGASEQARPLPTIPVDPILESAPASRT
jgi:putative ABC transport system ATP-binding protein